ncbi:MAG: hypothetical protein QM811_18960 [Pirellulales bacterium]
MLQRFFIIAMSLLNLTTSIIHADVPATQPAYPGSRIITSGKLVVEIMDPDAAEKYYTGVRFFAIGGGHSSDTRW